MLICDIKIIFVAKKIPNKESSHRQHAKDPTN